MRPGLLAYFQPAAPQGFSDRVYDCLAPSGSSLDTGSGPYSSDSTHLVGCETVSAWYYENPGLSRGILNFFTGQGKMCAYKGQAWRKCPQKTMESFFPEPSPFFSFFRRKAPGRRSKSDGKSAFSTERKMFRFLLKTIYFLDFSLK